MLRTIFVLAIVLVGTVYAVQGPFYGLLFYLWYAYFRPDYWMWDPGLIAPLNLSLVIGASVLIMSVSSIGRFRPTRLVILILLFLGQSIVSLWYSEHYAWSLRYWTDFVKVMIMTILITFLVSDRKRFRTVFLVIAFSLGLEMAKQGWAQLILNPGATNANTNPMLGDNNDVAVGMMMLIPIFVALAQTTSKRWERFIHRFFIVGVFYRGISTYSRGGFLAAGAIGLISFWRSKHKVRALVGIAVLAGIVWTVMPPDYWTRMGTMQSTQNDQDVQDVSEGRVFFWHIATLMAKSKPLTGVGFNGFEPSFSTYDTSSGAWGDNRAVHSAWFGVLADMGYPGLILMVAIILVALHTCRRVRLETRGKPDLRDLQAYAIALQTSFIAYIVGMTFLSGQYLEMFWHFIGLSVALQRISEAAMLPVTEPAQLPAVVGSFETLQPTYSAADVTLRGGSGHLA